MTYIQRELWNRLQGRIQQYKAAAKAVADYRQRIGGKPRTGEQGDQLAYLQRDAEMHLAALEGEAYKALVNFPKARGRMAQEFAAYAVERIEEIIERDGWADYSELSGRAQAEIERLGRIYDDFQRHTLFAARSGHGWRVFVIEDSLVAQAENQPGFYDDTFRVRFDGE